MALIRNHAFVDGNKRVGLMSAYTFLLLNGWELRAEEPEAVLMIRDVAASELGEPGARRLAAAAVGEAELRSPRGRRRADPDREVN